MLKKLTVMLVFCFTVLVFCSAWAWDLNSYLTRKAVNAGATATPKWTAKILKNGAKIYTGYVEYPSPNTCTRGSCEYDFRAHVGGEYNGQTISNKVISGHVVRNFKQGLGTYVKAFTTSTTDHPYSIAKFKLSSTGKQRLLNADKTALEEINSMTAGDGVYYKAVLYKGYRYNIRTQQRELVDKVKLVKVKTPEEAVIEDQRRSESNY